MDDNDQCFEMLVSQYAEGFPIVFTDKEQRYIYALRRESRCIERMCLLEKNQYFQAYDQAIGLLVLEKYTRGENDYIFLIIDGNLTIKPETRSIVYRGAYSSLYITR